MPYSLRGNQPGCSGWAVINTTTGHTIKCHPTKKAATAHLRALYKNVGDTTMQDLALNVSYPDAPGGMMEFGAAWEEKDHPRVPGGEHGGEFTSNPGAKPAPEPKPVTMHGIKIIKTEFGTALGRGGQSIGRQVWGARTADGKWTFKREDSPGTPWLIYHAPSVKDGSYILPVMTTGSLSRCAEAVARGWAASMLDIRKQEEAAGTSATAPGSSPDAPGGMMGFGAAWGDGADEMRAEASRRFAEDISTANAGRAWYEKDHPRKPPGSREGGEFTEKGGGGRRAPATPATRKPASPASPAPARTPKAPAKPPAGGTATPVSDPKQFLARYDRWRNGLTPAQDKALRFWQSPGFALMNGQLRGADPAKLKTAEHASDADLTRAKKASSDWKKAIGAAPPLDAPILTYRAFSAAQFGDLKEGDKITDKGFVAMSLLNDATAVGRAGNQATAEITLPAGTRLGAGSSREVDLAPPASFAVTGVTKRGGKVHYQLTYLPKGG